MLKVLIISHLLVLFFHIATLAAGDLSGVLEGIRKKYGDLPGFTVSYTREVITRSMTMLGNQIKGDLATGQIYFKSPCYLRLEQETPTKETIIADKDKLLWIVPDKKTAYEYSSKTFGMELRLLNDIFSGFSEINDKFRIAMFDQNKAECHGLELRPATPWQDVDRIRLIITTGYSINEVHIHNQFGSITSFRLSEMVIKESLGSALFSFIIPEGFQLIKE